MMRCRRLVMIILLCFVIVYIRRSTQCDKWLETGYVYPVGEQGEDRQTDLKCAFWYSGIVHMRLTKILLETRVTKDKTFKPIFEYNCNTKAQLAVLYNLKTERIGALWLVHLYINLVNKYYRSIKARFGYSNEKILTANDFVVDRLESDTAEHCRKGNRFDWNDKSITESLLSNVGYVHQLIGENTFDMANLLTANHTNNLLEFRSNTDNFHLPNILMNNFGIRNDLLRALMVDFNLGVIWLDTNERLSDAWYNTRDLNWATNKLQPFKFYYSVVLGVLEIIMLRMSWEYLLNQQRIVANEVKLSHAKKWRSHLEDFADVLKLRERKDTQIGYLINAFDSDTVTSGEHLLIDHLQTELTRLSEFLGCDATQTSSAYPSGELNPGNSDQVHVAIVGLRKYANTFIDLLKFEMLEQDFGIVWALEAYIDELNQYKLF